METISIILDVLKGSEITNVIVQGEVHGTRKHGWYVSFDDEKIGDHIMVPSNYLQTISGNGIGHIKHPSKLTSKISGHQKNSIFEFGLYKGLELGIVFAFDQHYIEWCIRNVESFYVKNLSVLYDFGVFLFSERYAPRNIEARYSGLMSYYTSIDNLSRALAILNDEFRFSPETEQLNEEKKNR